MVIIEKQSLAGCDVSKAFQCFLDQSGAWSVRCSRIALALIGPSYLSEAVSEYLQLPTQLSRHAPSPGDFAMTLTVAKSSMDLS